MLLQSSRARFGESASWSCTAVLGTCRSPGPAQPPLPAVAAAAAAAAAAELAAWPAGRDGTVALDVGCRVFDRILLTLDMVSDHLPDAYLSAIRNLR